jgi:hypothetical protein
MEGVLERQICLLCISGSPASSTPHVGEKMADSGASGTEEAIVEAKRP